MNIFISLILLTSAFAAMEGVAWLTHKYLMHGPLWHLHRDHHQPEKGKVIEKNDLFFLFFSFPGIVCIYFGFNSFSSLFWIGLGISLYGLCYALVHDAFIHRRIKIFRTSNLSYLKALKRAHKIHHKHLQKENGECFGMLWVPLKYFKEANKRP